MAIDYASSGVDIKSVRAVQKKINDMIKATFKLGKGIEVIDIGDHYAGIFRQGSGLFAMHCDGVGSKVLVAQELGKYDTVGIDAIAMNVNDIACVGAEPIACVDYLAVAKEDEKAITEILKGLVAGCGQAGCALIGGETAILPDIIKGAGQGYPFDLAVSCIGRVVAANPITGDAVAQGDCVIGLASTGLHSNGFTLARRVLDAATWGGEMLEPTAIYSRLVAGLVKRHPGGIHGMGHVTGGAFSKLKRLLRKPNLSLVLDALPEPREIFVEIGRQVEAREMYCTFNMGVGMALVCDGSIGGEIISEAKTAGIAASIIGRVAKSAGAEVRITPGLPGSKKEIVF